MHFDASRALTLLRVGTGNPAASFRDGQEEAIRHVVEGRGRLLVVQKTGWGKSSVYFVGTKLLREAGLGPALLVSPLLSLMRNQLAAAERMGVRAETINSDNTDDWPEIEQRIARDEVDILLISPERFANEHFRTRVLGRLAARVSLLVVDEAHCISDWGHDFRPQYRMIERVIRQLPSNLRLLATTATANARVLGDLEQVLGPGLTVMKGELHRPSLTLQTIRLPGQAERLAWLAEQLPTLPGSGIVYALTIHDAEIVTAWLRSRGIDVRTYTGQTGEERPALEEALLQNRVKALVATTALGMGFDKPDLAFVVHFQAPGSVVHYYQQVGRAGRGLPDAYGVLLSGKEEITITDFFIRSAFPTPDEAEAILEALDEAPGGLSIDELQGTVNVSRSRIDHALKLLSLEVPAPLVKDKAKWRRTAAPLAPSFWERAERLTALRREERAQMQHYAALTSGHMEFLVQALDGDPSTVTGPRMAPLPAAASPVLVREAETFLRRTSLPIHPRLQWPGGGLPDIGVRGRIAPEERAEEGRALGLWGDAGWGGLVRAGKYRDGRFGDQLVDACARLVREWRPAPAPGWVTCIPSRRHPNLVPDFAARLAHALSLPFVQVLAKTDDRPEQKTMANSAMQARNVDGSLALANGVFSAPVLLVDDMVDSGWTFTVAAALLRRAGVSAVLPLALARTGADE